MNHIEYFLWRLRLKFCRHFHISHIFETKVGVKSISGIKALPPIPLVNETFECDAKDLFLGIDYLKDDYTLLGQPLIKSPHYFFMKALMDKTDLSKSEYIQRLENGTLDARVASKKHTSFTYYEGMFDKRMSELKRDILQPVFVYRIEGNTYLYDGKHRAALCALMDKPIVCLEVSNERFGSTIGLVMNNPAYSKHIALYNRLGQK